MEVKYNNKWHDVLDTREFFGSTFYAIEIPTIALDFRFKEIGFVWLKWTCDVTFLK